MRKIDPDDLSRGEQNALGCFLLTGAGCVVAAAIIGAVLAAILFFVILYGVL